MLRDEIPSYTDGNRLVAPNLVAPGTIRGSDNGPCFTSEYFIMLKYRGEMGPGDISDYLSRLEPCFSPAGNLHRAPDATDQEQVDDFYLVLAACRILGCRVLARRILDYGWDNRGAYTSSSPGSWTWESFMWRQPQLLAAMYAAANQQSWRTFPLFAYAAIVIATSCIWAKPNDADSRRLSWGLIQTVAPVSRLCRLAAKIWYRRLYKTFPNGMRDVAALYYRDGHPFCRYWADAPPETIG